MIMNTIFTFQSISVIKVNSIFQKCSFTIKRNKLKVIEKRIYLKIYVFDEKVFYKSYLI